MGSFAMSGLHAPAKKRLGQHFLIDHSVIERIIMALAPAPGDRLVEIGPGRGALTLPLLRRHGSLCAIEFDRDLIEPLRAAALGLGTLDIISARSEERRVGNAWVSTCRSRWGPSQ